MNNNLLKTVEFIPTEEQIEIAKRWLDLGFNVEVCATKIINSSTAEPIAGATFKKVFKKQIREAMHSRLEAAAKCFANAAKKNPEMAARYLNTRGRGYFKERFELDTDQSIKNQYDQVLQAAARGLISAEEATQYAAVIKHKEECALHKLIKLMEGKVEPEKISEALGNTHVS